MSLLKVIFALIVLTMIVVTTIASLHENMFQINPVVTRDWWFRATLFDAYFGFLTFYCWVFYKESSWIARIAWFVLIMALGNAAMSTYMLIKLFKLGKNASFEKLLLR